MREQRSGQDRRRQSQAGNPADHNQFVANVSHEIRTPVQALVMSIDLMASTPLTPEQRRHVEVFRSASEHLLSLLDDLIDHASLQAGVFQLHTSRFHLPVMLENVCDLMRIHAAARQLVLRCEVDPALGWHEGDPQRLRQVLVNLVNNAIKFTATGEVVLRAIQLDGNRVQLEVADTGEGIAAEKLPDIFDAFVQGDDSTGRHRDGSGLGLAICRHLVTMMDGEIVVSSEPGRGSSFRCVVPLPAITGSDDSVVPMRSVYPEASAMPPLTVLVVDDSPLNMRMLEELLRQMGCRVACAANGRDALLRLMKEPCDLVLMDIRMPVMDGLQATRVLRHLEQQDPVSLPGTAPIPVIALSACGDPAERHAARQAGCDDYLVKPVRRDALEQVLLALRGVRESAAAGIPR